MKITFLYLILSLASAVSFAQTKHLGSIVKKGDPGAENYCSHPVGPSSICEMDQKDADSYCKSQNLRLPTARELALYGLSFGAKGILETAYPDVDVSDPRVQNEDAEMLKSGYLPVYKGTLEKGVVDFYYNNAGYKNPDDGSFGFSYWASSFIPVTPSSFYFFYTYTGAIDPSAHNTEPLAVRCFNP